MEPPVADVDVYATGVCPITHPNPLPEELRAAGPVVRAPVPMGGDVWVVTDETLARRALLDPRIVKDPAYAPEHWDRGAVGLEPTAAERTSLTTLDGPAHQRLRQAHNPLFTHRRMQEHAGRVAQIAATLLDELPAGPVDLAADFTMRYPLAVVCDLLGVPIDGNATALDEAAAACRQVFTGASDSGAAMMAALGRLAAGALTDGREGMARDLRERLPDMPDADLHYVLAGLIFAGQVTTTVVLGFLLARVLDGGITPMEPDGIDDVVRGTLREHPPAVVSLWRFTAEDVELGGVVIPARSGVLVDIAGINNDPARSGPQDLTFGAGPHYCVGSHLAQLELCTVVQVLQERFPDARLAVPYAELQRVDAGIHGSMLTAVPAVLA
ncbi:cytochrome P450 [Actinomycetes bacterium KLBMP 9759]